MTYLIISKEYIIFIFSSRLAFRKMRISFQCIFICVFIYAFIFRRLLDFAAENDEVVKQIADRGQSFIRNHLRMKDVLCYWRKLLRSYAQLLQYNPQKEEGLIEIRPES